MTRLYDLTPEQVQFFQTQGYISLPAVSAEVSLEISNWSDEIKNLPHRSDAWMHYEEVDSNGKRILCRTENYADYHAGFSKLFRGSEVLGILEQLSGEPMVLFKEKINYKQPYASGFKAHIDSPAYTHAGNLKHLTILMAAEEATPENGCLEVVPGSHLMDIPIGKDVCITDDWCKKQQWVSAPLKPGEFLVFGSYLAHRSGPNKSSRGRAAIYATFNAISDGGDRRAEYYADRREHWPPTKDRDPTKKYETGAVRYGFGSPMLTVDNVHYAKMGL